nr:30S ribosomal protein S20 [Xanthomonas campestris pv. campestris]
MANIKSAKKRAKQTVVRNERNTGQRSDAAHRRQEGDQGPDANDAAGAEAAFAVAQPILDRFSARGLSSQEQGCASQEPPDRSHQGHQGRVSDQ